MLRNYFLPAAFLLVAVQSMAQAPSGVPYGQPEPLELDLFNIIVFIVLPLVLIAVYIGFKRKNRKK